MSTPIVGNWAKNQNTTIAADIISTVLTDPGAGLKRVAKNIHVQVDPADAGSGEVEVRVLRGATSESWTLLFDATQGCWWDCTSMIEANVGETLTIEVERAGLTAASITCEVATKQAAP